MCGICGIYDPSRRLSPSQIKNSISGMMEEFPYRGPDGEGIYFDENNGIGLGHRRLSIIDLNDGKQPMSHADNSTWVVFNGEIYNYQSERAELEKKGHQFRTRSDTEVLLALYHQYGNDAWARLVGQFALGLWDGRLKRFILVRDRFGEKPLSYSIHKNTLIFCSEVKSLLKHPEISRELDESALPIYMLLQHTPPPSTLIKNVFKLPPGHTLTGSTTGFKLERYWRPQFSPALKFTNDESATESFREKFLTAVERCTVSDVPIGTCLSGGLDSTAVTWGVKNVHPGPLHSFAVFNKPSHLDHPDWPYAQQAAAHLDTEHHNFFYELPELMKLLPEFIETLDEPFEGPTALVSYFLFKNARNYAKVVLTGNGGDELLGGYQDYYRRMFRVQTLWQWIDKLIPRSIRRGFKLAPNDSILYRIGISNENRRIHANLQFHKNWFNPLFPHQNESVQKNIESTMSQLSPTEKNLYIKRYLWDDLFVFHNHSITTMPDSTGMASSLEARNPFLDFELAEFLFRLPPNYLIRKNAPNKYLLVKSMENRIPSPILTRPKEGFSGMTSHQLIHWANVEGKPLLRDALLGSQLAKMKLFSEKELSRLWDQFSKSGTTAESIYYFIPIWSFLLLELWYRKHILNVD